MQNPFAKDNININSEIHSLMKMNPQQSYIQGFKNCYYQGNQNNNNNQNNNDINKFTIISTYINDNPNDIIFGKGKKAKDPNKFINLCNNVQPQFYGKNVQINMILGGDNQQNNINPENNNEQEPGNSFNNNDDSDKKDPNISDNNINEIQKKGFDEQNGNNNNNINEEKSDNNNNPQYSISNNVNINIKSSPKNPQKEKEEDNKQNKEVKDDKNNIINMREALNKKMRDEGKNEKEIEEAKKKKEEDEKKKKEQEEKRKEELKKYIAKTECMNKALKELMFNQDDKSKSEKEEPGEKGQESVDKIKIKFFVGKNPFPIEYEVNPNEIISKVLSEFINHYPEFEQLFQNGIYAMHNSNVVKQEKSFIENYIKNGDNIFLYWFEKKDQNYKSNIEEDQREIFTRFKREYLANKLLEYTKDLYGHNKLNNADINIFDDQSIKAEFIAFATSKLKENNSTIEILEHEHKLVCCLTNYGWTCNQCGKSYGAQEEKFCCTLCEYYMCHTCRKIKDYDRRQAINRDITLDNEKYRNKFLETKLHPHKLMYCITSRCYSQDTRFKCDICKKHFYSWGFYCSVCDFDVCIDCGLNHK